MQAALENHPSTVKLLASLGAKVEAHDLGGRTALANAALDQYTRTVAALIECGADVNAADKWGGTALHIAARRGNKEIVRMLVQAKADIGLREHSGRTPWIVAVHSNKAAGLRDLLEPDPEKEKFLRELQRDKHPGDIAKHMNMIYR
jgi:ankyrin repeat protein